MSHNSNLEDDEIDLGELFAALWSHKLLITLFTGLSIFLAGYYAITTEKKFTAKSIFQIEQNEAITLALIFLENLLWLLSLALLVQGNF